RIVMVSLNFFNLFDWSLFVLLCLAASCKSEAADIKSDKNNRWEPGMACYGDSCFSLDRFAQEIEEHLMAEARIVKYAYNVSHDGQERTGAYGFKNLEVNGYAPVFTVDDRFNPASVSKMVTAVALVIALHQRNID